MNEIDRGYFQTLKLIMLPFIKKHWSSTFLAIIIVILIVPSWRISFQGWFQGLFMSDIEFVRTENEQIPATILEWQLSDMDEKKFDFEQFIDKPILISFWATWCPPCRAELKELKKLHAELGGQMHFLSVSEESHETIINSGLIEDYSFLYSTIAYPSYFQITAYPTLFLLDKDGIVIFKHSGSGGLDNEKNQSFLRALIENR